MANIKDEIKKHIEKEHKVRPEKSQDVCYHYRNGFGFRGEKNQITFQQETLCDETKPCYFKTIFHKQT